MANLLPPETRLKLLWQRRVRRSVVLLVAGLTGVILAALAILPVAVYTQIIKVGISSDVELIETSGTGKDHQELIKKLKKTKELIDQMSLIANMPEFNEVFNYPMLILSKIEGAKMHSIVINSNLEDSKYVIRLSGIVQNRESVFAIQGAFNQSDEISVLDFPDNNFTSSDDEYNFVIEISTLSTD